MGTEIKERDEGYLEQGEPKEPSKKGTEGSCPFLTHLNLSQTDLPLQILRDHFPSRKENGVGTEAMGFLG